jgi:hypothetical protein
MARVAIAQSCVAGKKDYVTRAKAGVAIAVYSLSANYYLLTLHILIVLIKAQ